MKRLRNIESRAWIEVNLDDLRRNAVELQRLLPAGCALMAVVKADAYGHGSVTVSRALNGVGVRSFCVASADEGAELRRGGVHGEILILGFTHPSEFDLLRRYRLTQTVVDYDYAMLLKNYGKPVNVHIKIDTGMHRLGIWAEDIDRIVEIFMCKNLLIDGLYTHLCASDGRTESDICFSQTQTARFQHVLNELPKRGYKLPKTHIQSSYGIFNYPDLACGYVRAGLALYGTVDESSLFKPSGADLRPVLSVKARTELVRSVAQGEPVGYGFRYVAPRDMKIAVLSIGYADGIPRGISGTPAWAVINGGKAPFVGSVCMDSLTVDVTDIDEIAQGDIAVIMGSSGNNEMTIVEAARLAGTIPNEILSRLGKRLGKKYLSVL